MATHEPISRPADPLEDERRDANTTLGAGLGIGAFGLASAALLGATCPVCVVAAPALIGYGALKRVRCARAARRRDLHREVGAAGTSTDA